MFKTFITIGALALSTSVAFADVTANKQTAADALNEVLVGLDASKINTYFAEPYIQHNPIAPSGLDAFAGIVGYAKKEGLSFKMDAVRVIGEGDLVAMHNVWTGLGPKPVVGFDVFRFNDDGKIVEHWDNLSPMVDEPNPSGRTQIDGATEITDLDKTDANKAVVLELMNKMFINGEKIDVTKYINPASYLQHNSMAGDGLEGLGALMKAMAEKGIKMIYKKVPLVVAEGNFVLTGSEGTFADKPTAFYDLFRLEDGRIVEHWDVIADIQTDNLPEGYPGKF